MYINLYTYITIQTRFKGIETNNTYLEAWGGDYDGITIQTRFKGIETSQQVSLYRESYDYNIDPI